MKKKVPVTEEMMTTVVSRVLNEKNSHKVIAITNPVEAIKYNTSISNGEILLLWWPQGWIYPRTCVLTISQIQEGKVA